MVIVMTEKERYIPKWEKGKIIGAKDTELHLTLNVKIMIRELNGQNQRIKELEQENERMKTAFKRKYDYDIAEIVDEVYDGDGVND